MDTRPWKIVVSGPPGSGKTTLVRALAAKLGVPAIPEQMKDIYAAKADFHERRRAGADQPALDALLGRWMGEFFAWIDQRGNAYGADRGFVADKWEADLLAVWLGQFNQYQNDPATLRLVQALQSRARLFDLVVLLPLPKGTPERKNEDELKRRQSLASYLLSNVLVSGIVSEFTRLPILRVPSRLPTVDARVDHVEAAIRNISSTAGPPAH